MVKNNINIYNLLLKFIILIFILLALFLLFLSLKNNSIKRGVNMKCKCCDSKGYHYHYIDSKIFKIPNHASSNNICHICKKNSDKFHYHFDNKNNMISQNEPTSFQLC